jgi:hypothetical protein
VGGHPIQGFSSISLRPEMNRAQADRNLKDLDETLREPALSS